MSPHELLPWYVNGTLDPRDRDEFERHLSTCADCANEVALVTPLAGRLRGASKGSFAEHPGPHELLAAVAPEEAEESIAPERVQIVRDHVGLCFACRQEIDWLRGHGVATAESARVPVTNFRARAGRIAAAAAGLILAVLSFQAGRMAVREPARGGLTRLQPVLSTQRDSDAVTIIRPVPGSDHVTLLLEADLGPRDLPARLTVVAGDRNAITPATITADDLFNGAYITFECPLFACTPGDYVASLAPAGGRVPPTEYRFRILEAGSPAPGNEAGSPPR